MDSVRPAVLGTWKRTLEAPDELACQISVLLVFLAGWQKTTYAYIWEVSEQIHCCFITLILAELAGCHLAKVSWLAKLNRFFNCKSLFFMF